MEDKATMQSNGAAQLNEELRSVLSTFVCGGSISYKQLPEVQYKGKSTPLWSLLEEFGWKKKAERKGADWTFENTRLSLNSIDLVSRMVSVTKKQLGLSLVVLPTQDVSTVFAMQGKINITPKLCNSTKLPYKDPEFIN